MYIYTFSVALKIRYLMYIYGGYFVPVARKTNNANIQRSVSMSNDLHEQSLGLTRENLPSVFATMYN